MNSQNLIIAAFTVALFTAPLCAQTQLPAPSSPQNHLAGEKSPYLLEHASNPVDWYPWSDKPFAKAKAEGKLVFLSIGYSSCHWCHVMARESFEDAEIAKVLNENFVSIKVDREERPDIDAVYLAYVEGRTGSGGWPMTVILTPDRHPVFGGTYFPPRNRAGDPGLLELLKAVEDEWKKNRAEVEQSGVAAVELLTKQLAPAERDDWPPDVLARTVALFVDRAELDAKTPPRGPLFPQPMMLELLLIEYGKSGDKAALATLKNVLDAMENGGIHDPVGGGFFRYSVDGKWLVPHFEKMLYVNALLARLYLLAFQATGEARYAVTARDILDYLLRDMQLDGGGFAAAQDADSRGPDGALEEGRYYTFTPDELRASQSSEVADSIVKIFNLSDKGHVGGRSVPNRMGKAGFEPVEIAKARELLFELRSQRPRPRRDDKVLADWNGLAISAFALAGRVLGDARYRVAARGAADFVLTKLWDGTSQSLLRRYRDDDSAIPGQLSDYAYLCQGLLDLYSTDLDPRDLNSAVELCDSMILKFYDSKRTVFFDTSKDGDALIVRPRDGRDSALPAPTAIALRCLLRVARLTGRGDLEFVAKSCLGLYANEVRTSIIEHAELVHVAEELATKPREIVFAGTRHSKGLEALLNAWYSAPRPGFVVAFAPEDDDSREQCWRIEDLIEGRIPQEGNAAAYVCENRVCQEPILDPEKLANLKIPTEPDAAKKKGP